MANCKSCTYNPVCELWREAECQDANSQLTGGLRDCPIYKQTSDRGMRKITNHEYLFSISIDALAEKISKVFDCDHNRCPAQKYGCISCKQSWVRYLESEAQQDG